MRRKQTIPHNRKIQALLLALVTFASLAINSLPIRLGRAMASVDAPAPASISLAAGSQIQESQETQANSDIQGKTNLDDLAVIVNKVESRPYNGELWTIDVSSNVTLILNGQPFTGKYMLDLVVSGEVPGDYLIKPKFGYENQYNYSYPNDRRALEITKSEVQIDIDMASATVNFGDPVPSTLTGTPRNPIRTDDIGSFDIVTIIDGLKSWTNCNAGIYTVSANVNSRLYKNFKINKGTLTVKPKVSYSFSGTVPSGVSLPDAGFIDFDTKIEVAPAPKAVANWAFNGWTSPDVTLSGGSFMVSSKSPVNEVHLVGSFKRTDQFTVTYMMDRQVVDKRSFFAGDKIELPPAPVLENYQFIAWKNVPATMPSRDITIEADYRRTAFNLTFVCDDTQISSDLLKPGSPVKVPEMEEKEDYIFSGWLDVPSVMPDSDLTIVSGYKRMFYTVTYILDEREYAVQKYRTGSLLPHLAEPPASDGYIFTGWDFSGFPSAMGENDLVVHGYFLTQEELDAKNKGAGIALLNIVFCMMCFACLIAYTAIVRSRGMFRLGRFLACLVPGICSMVLFALTFVSPTPISMSDDYTPLFALISLTAVYLAVTSSQNRAVRKKRLRSGRRHSTYEEEEANNNLLSPPPAQAQKTGVL